MVYLSRPYHFKFFKGCLPQILLGPFLNTLSHMIGSYHALVITSNIFICWFIAIYFGFCNMLRIKIFHKNTAIFYVFYLLNVQIISICILYNHTVTLHYISYIRCLTKQEIETLTKPYSQDNILILLDLFRQTRLLFQIL